MPGYLLQVRGSIQIIQLARNLPKSVPLNFNLIQIRLPAGSSPRTGEGLDSSHPAGRPDGCGSPPCSALASWPRAGGAHDGQHQLPLGRRQRAERQRGVKQCSPAACQVSLNTQPKP